MAPYIKPADRLVGCKLNGGWEVVEVYTPPLDTSINYSSCYKVKNGNQKGFLKAFDYSDLKKPGGKGQHKRLIQKFERELSMLKKCREKNINTVIKLLTHDSYYFEEGKVDELVEYFILEFSDDGNMQDCLMGGSLKDFSNKFQALVYIFDGLNDLHANGIMHLDLKAGNLLYFVKDRLTKITDFGSARQLIHNMDEDLLDDLNSINTTRQYAPPECLYNDFDNSDWQENRRKIDLFLAGNIIVKLFTNFSFTTLLKESVTEFYDWNNTQNQNSGKFKQFLEHLVEGATEVYIKIEGELNRINNDCGRPLDDKDIYDLMKIITQLCHPDPLERGHPEELARKNNRDGLDRYRDRCRTFRDKCEERAK